MEVVLCVFAYFVGLVVAQTPEICRAPTVFEAKEQRVDFARHMEVGSTIGQDADNERFYRKETSVVSNLTVTLDLYHEIWSYREHALYRINMRTGECMRMGIVTSFEPIGIPLDARFVGYRHIGSSGIRNSNILTTNWVGENTEKKYRYDLVFTDASLGSSACLPVRVTRFYDDDRSLEQASLFDVTAGISDPTVFTPPDHCPPPPPLPPPTKQSSLFETL
ncbi:mammalian ependymin-related protein 1-like [Oscarella lobularis]|uniref:mammalian ependymin-related protein 1-like n=1 Tax=Oscarella lobularis TaxID=121494 RepID=UPI0033140A99